MSSRDPCRVALSLVLLLLGLGSPRYNKLRRSLNTGYTMRRLDLQPLRKLRNPARHLRALKKWQDTIHGTFQNGLHPHDCDKYWNIKLPVYAKLCNPPHTTPDLQRACVDALITAAQNIRALSKIDRPYRLAILIETPCLFSSEVTLFFDADCLASFYPPTQFEVTENIAGQTRTLAPQMEQYGALNLVIPPEFEFSGGYGVIEEDWEGPRVHRNHWLIVERVWLD